MLLPGSWWICLSVQESQASALWLCLICKIKEQCFSAACFLGYWDTWVPTGEECSGSAKPRPLSQCIHNLSMQHQFFVQSIMDSWVWFSLFSVCSQPVSLHLFCVFQLHIFTQLPCSEERVRTSTRGPCWLGKWKTYLQECAGRWRYPVPGAEWSQATF